MWSRARRVTGRAEPFEWRERSAGGGAAQASREPQAPPPRPGPASEDQRLAALERDAFARGYAQGEKAGAEVAAERAEAMLRRLAATIDELASLRQDLLKGTEHQIVRLAMAIARRMLDRELAADRGLLVAMARVALDRLGEQVTARIRLHPEDHAAVMAAGADRFLTAQVEIVADPAVGRGGCLVQSEVGLMDVSLDAQFAELARTLLGDGEPVRAVDRID
jgi:flagellar assembly protein FliH